MSAKTILNIGKICQGLASSDNASQAGEADQGLSCHYSSASMHKSLTE